MTRRSPAALLVFALFAAAPLPAPSDTALRTALQRDLNQYLSARAKIEHVSAISLGVSLHGRKTVARCCGAHRGCQHERCER